jgi:hypothetical protein
MRHKITEKTASLVGRLGELAGEIEGGLLGAASADARSEWVLVRTSWPTSADVRSGVIGVSDDELDLMIEKVLRFRSILRRLRVVSAAPALAMVAAAAA